MSGSLGNKALGAASWTVGARLGRTLVGIGSLAILSRFLGPEEFGIAALVLFVSTLATMFTDFGTRVALVQRKEVTAIEINSVYWSNLGLSVAASGGLWLFAPQIAGLLNNPGLAEPLRWVSPVFVMGGMMGVSLSMLERKLKFRTIALTEVSAAAVGAVVAITMVLMGFRVGALIGQQLAATGVMAISYILAASWRPRLLFSWAALRPLLSYGSYVTGAGMVQFFSTQADRPIVGHRLSAADLGFIAMSDQIVGAPLRIIVSMVRKVMFPIMASIQDDADRMSRGLLEVQYGLVVVMAPICLGLWALAGPTVTLLLGPGWEMVAAIMGFTTLRAFLNVYTDVNAIVFSAKGQAKFQFHWSIFSLLANVLVLLMSASFGLIAVVASRLALSLVLVPINSWFAVRLLGLPLMDRMWVTMRPILSAVAMAAAVSLTDQALAPHLGTVPRLAVGVPLGILCYITAELLIDRGRFLPLARRLIALRRGRKRPTQAPA